MIGRLTAGSEAAGCPGGFRSGSAFVALRTLHRSQIINIYEGSCSNAGLATVVLKELCHQFRVA